MLGYRETHLHAFENLHRPKQPFAIHQLLASITQQSAVKRVLIEGRAGIGKSIFCQYLAHQFALGNSNILGSLTRFRAIIWLPLRSLLEYSATLTHLSLAQFVHDYGLLEIDQQEITVEVLAKELITLQGQQQILWLFDGYDEVITISREKSARGQLLHRLLQEQHWILTSRPLYVSDTLGYERHLEILGFTPENRKRYIQRFFFDMKNQIPQAEAKGKALTEWLEQHTLLQSIGYVPINLELLCSVWFEQSSPNTQQPLTITTLYQQLLSHLLRRYLIRQDAMQDKIYQAMEASEILNHPSIQIVLSCLSEIAWQAMQSNTLIISATAIKNCLAHYAHNVEAKINLAEQLKTLGFLKPIVTVHKTDPLGQDYYFIHLTFQDLFAAHYLVRGLKAPSSSVRHQQAVQFIRCYKYELRYQFVFSFTAGLLKGDEKIFDLYWHRLQEEPKDVLGLYGLCLEMQCLNETETPEKWTKLWLPTLFEWISQYIIENRNSVRKDIIEVLITCLSTNNHITQYPLFKKIYQSEWSFQIREKLEHTDRKIKYRGCCAMSNLFQIAPQYADILLPALLSILKDKSICDTAHNAIQKLCQAAPQYVSKLFPPLLKALKDENIYISSYVCDTLAVLCQVSPQYADTLLEALLNILKEDSVKQRSTYKGTKENIDLLGSVLGSSNSYVHYLINEELKKFYINIARALIVLCQVAPQHLKIVFDTLLDILVDFLVKKQVSSFEMTEIWYELSTVLRTIDPQYAILLLSRLLPLLLTTYEEIHLSVWMGLATICLAIPNYFDKMFLPSFNNILKNRSVWHVSMDRFIDTELSINMLNVLQQWHEDPLTLIVRNYAEKLVLPTMAALNNISDINEERVFRVFLLLCTEASQHIDTLFPHLLKILKQGKFFLSGSRELTQVAHLPSLTVRHAELLLPVLLAGLDDKKYPYKRADACEAWTKLCFLIPHHSQSLLLPLLTALQVTEEYSELGSMVKTANDHVHASACQALAALCQVAPQYADELFFPLMAALKHHDSTVRANACDALAVLCQVAPHYLDKVLPLLMVTVKDKHFYLSHRLNIWQSFGVLCHTEPHYTKLLFKELSLDDKAKHPFLPANYFEQFGKLSFLKQFPLPSTPTQTSMFSAVTSWVTFHTTTIFAPGLLLFLWTLSVNALRNNQAIYAILGSPETVQLYGYENKQVVSIELTIEQAEIICFLLKHISIKLKRGEYTFKYRPNFASLEKTYYYQQDKLHQQFLSAFHLSDDDSHQAIMVTNMNWDALREMPSAASLAVRSDINHISPSNPIQSPANDFAQRFNHESQPLLRLLQQWQQAPLLITEHKTIIITLNTDATMESFIAEEWLNQCGKVITNIWKNSITTQSVKISSDELFHTLSFDTKTSEHAKSISNVLQTSNLFTLQFLQKNTL